VEEHNRTGYEELLQQSNPSTGFIHGAQHGAQQDLVAIYAAFKRPEEARGFRDELARAKMQNATVADPK
jgi:hypothetical protein